MTPRVAVVVPAYNAGPWLRDALRSALAQSYQDFELVVVDDGSTDETREAAQAIDDPRVRLISQPRRGASAARNAGVLATSAPYLAFLDADDLWHVEKLRLQTVFLDAHPETDLVFGRNFWIRSDGSPFGYVSPAREGPVSFRQLLVENVTGTASSVMVRRAALRDAGGFDEDLPACNDHDTWLRVALLRDGNVSALPWILTCYRRREGQITSDFERMENAWKQLLERRRPRLVPSAIRQATADKLRFFAFIAFERREVRAAARFLVRATRMAPRSVGLDFRNWLLVCGVIAAAVLPASWLERLKRGAARGPVPDGFDVRPPPAGA